MVDIPDNPYKRFLAPIEIKELLEDGWRQSSLSGCDECFCSGCDKCHNTGVIGTYHKEGKFVFGSPSFATYDTVGASCRVNYFGQYDRKIHFYANGCGGQAELVFSIPQAVKLMKMIVDVMDNSSGNCKEEFYIEAKFRGPPSMSLASLTKDRVTVSVIPDENKLKALKLLSEAGLKDEMLLLKAAFEHEVFRGDEEENRKAREVVGEIKPGTIFKRKGESAIVGETVIRVDKDRSLLSK